jgi:hypothetical protein
MGSTIFILKGSIMVFIALHHHPQQFPFLVGFAAVLSGVSFNVLLT